MLSKQYYVICWDDDDDDDDDGGGGGGGDDDDSVDVDAASMFILLKISAAAINTTGDNMSAWQTPFMVLIFSLIFSVLTCAVFSGFVHNMRRSYRIKVPGL